MEHKLAYTEAKALCYRAKLKARFHFTEIFNDTYQVCIRCQCLVDRVFRNSRVRNSEFLLYIHVHHSVLLTALPTKREMSILGLSAVLF